ncbi:hypothetical protein BDP55DRAFT_734946 [Colletotrichum godetiae]|uniref:Uncharacterized protein n=1 Tax=Colletotrichum godetiae TaxID=1209918 RepID=A0AAJ0ENA5_9PEZI|nr:uncharacterized protein BDP55DRAFT_734946 [Colletotrichum godetiae]KAK1657377.1 hypothetical protein BDP55DRAFT_734946 [Colletotrichum godetiae]
MTRHHRPTALHLAAVLALLSATTNLPGQMFVPGVAAIEDLEAEDVPPECVQVCAPIVQLTARCEAQVKAQFGTDKRDLSTRQHQDISETRDVEETTLRRLSGRRRRRRDLQRMLGRRLSSRQEPESDGDSSDEEEETASLTPGSGLVAAPTLGVGRSASESAAKEAAEAAAENASRAYQGDHWRMRLRCRAGRSGAGGHHFYHYNHLSADSTTAGVESGSNNNITRKLGAHPAFPIFIYTLILIIDTPTASISHTTGHPNVLLNNSTAADLPAGSANFLSVNSPSAAALRTARQCGVLDAVFGVHHACDGVCSAQFPDVAVHCAPE